MPSAHDSAGTYITNPSPTEAADQAEVRDDLGERMHTMSKCSPDDAEQILKMVANPQPLSDEVKVVHEAGLARFAASFRIAE